MKAKTRILLSVLLMFAVGAGVLYGGTTGKIAGRVTDAATGEPLIGSTVVIKGTATGAASDVDGNFMILNIPSGVYTVLVSIIGYQQVQFENVQVSIDLTTTLNPRLQAQTVELGETIVVTAERPLVTRDMTSSISTMTADQIEKLPIQQVQEVLRLNAGIIEDAGRLSIRGGRTSEVGYWVDGVSATDLYDGRMGTTVQPSAIQEIQVISGTFNAEYGQAMSGIVNIITKQGGEQYHGEIKLYGGDYVSSDDKFSLYRRLLTDSDPATRLERVVYSEREQPLKKIKADIYNAEASLSGPVPVSNDVTFFLNGRYFYDGGYFYGMNWFMPNGIPGDSSLVALNPYENISAQGKLNFQLSSDVRVTYNVFWNKSKRERNYFRYNSADYQFNPTGLSNYQQFAVHDFKYVPYSLPQAHGKGITNTVTLNHFVSPTTFYELRASRYYSESKQYVYEDPYLSTAYLTQVDTAGRITYLPDPNGPQGYIDPESIDPPTSYSFLNKGMDATNAQRSSAYWVAKFDLTSQVNATHQIKVGSEVRLHELTLHAFQIVPKTDADGQPIVPFQSAVPPVGSIWRNDYDRKPREISAYIQDKAEFNDIIFNVGLRYDYFNANSVVPADPTDPNVYNPFKPEHIYKNYSPTLPEDQLIEYTPDERRAFMQKDVKAKMALSPRLGIAFPITDRGVIHFSYGHFFQIPEFQYLYTNPDFKVTSGSGTAIFGNADLKPQRTVMYELGLQQQITDDVGIDLTLFYRDVRDWVGTSPIVATVKTAVEYSTYENKDYSNVRGITLKVEKRLTGNFSFRADYTFQTAEGTYSNPTDAYNAALGNRAPVLALVPMNWDQRHTFNAQLMYNVSDWTFSLIGRYWSGMPYTPTFPRSESVGASAVSGLLTNSERRPDRKGVDLTINKLFRLGSSLRFELFVNVYNLFDQRDETVVYGDTGTADYTTGIDPSIVPYNSTRVSTVEDFVIQPSWYTAPRQIQVGINFGF